MEFILILFALLKLYLIVGVIFTVLLGVIAHITKTENNYTMLEIFCIIFIYPIVIYHILNPDKND